MARYNDILHLANPHSSLTGRLLSIHITSIPSAPTIFPAVVALVKQNPTLLSLALCFTQTHFVEPSLYIFDLSCLRHLHLVLCPPELMAAIIHSAPELFELDVGVIFGSSDGLPILPEGGLPTVRKLKLQVLERGSVATASRHPLAHIAAVATFIDHCPTLQFLNLQWAFAEQIVTPGGPFPSSIDHFIRSLPPSLQHLVVGPGELVRFGLALGLLLRNPPSYEDNSNLFLPRLSHITLNWKDIDGVALDAATDLVEACLSRSIIMYGNLQQAASDLRPNLPVYVSAMAMGTMATLAATRPSSFAARPRIRSRPVLLSPTPDRVTPIDVITLLLNHFTIPFLAVLAMRESNFCLPCPHR